MPMRPVVIPTSCVPRRRALQPNATWFVWLCGLAVIASTSACSVFGLRGNLTWLDGASRLPAGNGALRVRWSRDITDPYDGPYDPVEHAVPALDAPRNRLYVGSTQGLLWAMSGGGRKLYLYEAGSPIESQPALDPVANEVYVGTEDGILHALHADTGELRWRAQAQAPIRQAALLHEDAVYIVTDDDEVIAFSRRNGDRLWQYHREPPEGFSVTQHAGLTLAQGKLLTGFTDGSVVALDPTDGRVLWERDTSIDVEEGENSGNFLDVDTTPVVENDLVYVASFSAGLYALELETGGVHWHDPALTGVTSIAAANEKLVLASADEGLVCIEARAAVDGDTRVLWRHHFDRGAPGELRIAGPLVLVGESLGGFLAASLETGEELSRFEAGFGFSAPAAVASGRGYVVSNSGSLYAFDLQD